MNHTMYLYTWRSTGDGVRNQTDYITINKKSGNSIQQEEGYPGADGGSNHVPIVATLRLKLKKNAPEEDIRQAESGVTSHT